MSAASRLSETSEADHRNKTVGVTHITLCLLFPFSFLVLLFFFVKLKQAHVITLLTLFPPEGVSYSRSSSSKSSSRSGLKSL